MKKKNPGKNSDFITLEPKFENMMGFTQGFTHAETEKLLDDI